MGYPSGRDLYAFMGAASMSAGLRPRRFRSRDFPSLGTGQLDPLAAARSIGLPPLSRAPMAELVDASDSKFGFRKECWFDSG